jgi:glycerophosphoryl diester phosphodiesterase
MLVRHPFLDHPSPLPIAHRGGSLEAEENTLPAFAHAVALGFSHVELDVRASRDGVVVVHHDETLARMFGDTRAVSELTWQELSGLRTRGGASVPLLAEVLASWPNLFINIEPKDDAVVEPLAALLLEANALSRVAVGSFAGERTDRLGDLLGPGLCRSPDWRGVLAVRLAGLGLPVRRPDCEVLQVPQTWRGVPVVVPGFIRAAHRFGLPVQVWTVNDGADMVHLLDMGVDAIMTDRPTLLRDLLRKRGAWHGRDA